MRRCHFQNFMTQFRVANFRGLRPVHWWRLALAVAVGTAGLAGSARADTSDPAVRSLIGTLLQKGIISDDEAGKLQSQMDSQQTNAPVPTPNSIWKINPGIKDLELYGDLRTRFENRSELDPSADKVELQRFRYSARLGIRGEALDDFYYGFRVETASNARSTFVTMGTSASGIPYQGPYGKSTAGINIGQVYIGWHPESWLDLTVGKMANPLYTTTMLWSRNINPEGLAERFHYSVGQVSFFANFGQFLYQDANPVVESPDLGLGAPGYLGNGNNIFQVAWQSGLNYQITTNTSFKVAATLYEYYGLQPTTSSAGLPPYFSDTYVGEGAYAGPGTAFGNYGNSGYQSPAISTLTPLTGAYIYGYPNNQVGINNLEVVEIPFEFNFKISQLDARIFGDGAYNFDGAARAEAAQAAYANYVTQVNPNNGGVFSAQTHDVKAYQILRSAIRAVWAWRTAAGRLENMPGRSGLSGSMWSNMPSIPTCWTWMYLPPPKICRAFMRRPLMVSVKILSARFIMVMRPALMTNWAPAAPARTFPKLIRSTSLSCFNWI